MQCKISFDSILPDSRFINWQLHNSATGLLCLEIFSIRFKLPMQINSEKYFLFSEL